MNNHLSKPTMLFHWLTGGTFLLVLGLGLYMSELPNGADKWAMMGWHKSFGAILFVIAITRLIWRFKEGHITPVAILTRAQAILATSVHHLLLLATISMPLSGILMSVGGGRGIDVFGLSVIAAGDKIDWLGAIGHNVHVYSVNVVIALLLLHIVGAMKHQFIDKDGTISRMLGNFHQ